MRFENCQFYGDKHGITLGPAHVVIRGCQWYSAPPLAERFRDFCDRLNSALAKHGMAAV